MLLSEAMTHSMRRVHLCHLVQVPVGWVGGLVIEASPWT